MATNARPVGASAGAVAETPASKRREVRLTDPEQRANAASAAIGSSSAGPQSLGSREVRQLTQEELAKLTPQEALGYFRELCPNSIVTLRDGKIHVNGPTLVYEEARVDLTEKN